jgi:hypothetical protein
MEKLTDAQWIRNQGECCIPGCSNIPVHVDDLDNVFCDDCVQQDIEENPENWEEYNHE